jgi:uncharacterized membrane protein YbaN (DUF454 family)
LRKFLRILAGVGLCILGVIGWILPVMPGWPFMIAGLVILAEFSPQLKRRLDWAKARFEQELAAHRSASTAPKWSLARAKAHIAQAWATCRGRSKPPTAE